MTPRRDLISYHMWKRLCGCVRALGSRGKFLLNRFYKLHHFGLILLSIQTVVLDRLHQNYVFCCTFLKPRAVHMVETSWWRVSACINVFQLHRSARIHSTLIAQSDLPQNWYCTVLHKTATKILLDPSRTAWHLQHHCCNTQHIGPFKLSQAGG